jgi:hypothetical protein
MTYAYVATNLLDLREQSSFNSGRVNQLFFATPVKVLRTDGDYCFVEESGGYQGWAHQNGLTKISLRDYRLSTGSSNGVVVATGGADILDPRHNKSIEPFFAYYGTKLTVTSWRDPYLTIRLPDGQTRRVKHSRIKPMKDKKAPILTGRRLVTEARRFLGIPYLWGGITTAGFDCSGLVQTVCGRFGIAVPRDTKDQILVGDPVSRTEVRSGDLLFFDRHVGFAVGGTRIIHASVSGTGVRINSLTAGEADYREDLDRSFRIARRIV